MTKRSHPELDGQHPSTLYTFALKRPGQVLRERLAWGAVGLAVGLGLAAGYIVLTGEERSWSLPSGRAVEASVNNPFRQGVEQAMAAAELTQTAEFSEEWAEVALLWQRAIAHMQAVPKGSSDRSLAQEKVGEYQRNLQYAQSNIASRSRRAPGASNYWTLGSDRDLVLAIQGTPSQIMQFHSSCHQTLRYGDSVVELSNGYVKQYNNLDGGLRVLANGPVVLSAQATAGTWTLGATEAEVVQIQGTPTRQEQYTANRFTTLYFGKSSVMFDQGQAISYVNTDNNLKVSLQLRPLPQGQTAPGVWSMGSSRAEVLRAEGQTPKAIGRNDNNCEEIFYFGEGEVTFRQGVVSGYRDPNQALKVR